MDFSSIDWNEMGGATIDTLQMMGFATLFTFIIGLPLGIILFVFSKSNSIVLQAIYRVLSLVVNIIRSVPFIILILALIPFTRMIMGVSTGVEGTIPPLVIAAAPFLQDS